MDEAVGGLELIFGFFEFLNFLKSTVFALWKGAIEDACAQNAIVWLRGKMV